MPMYNMQNEETGEIKQVLLTISERETWLEENPGWKQTLSAPKIVGFTGNWFARTDDGFKEVMKKIRKGQPKDNLLRD